MKYIKDRIYRWDNSHYLRCSKSGDSKDNFYYGNHFHISENATFNFHDNPNSHLTTGILYEATEEETDYFLHFESTQEWISLEDFLKLETFYECY